ncbi:secretory carrier-associated membrane protein 5-like [Daphnia pulex]|uniref:secretory carrier-associated membrane protein 5-like n=1 Tax=Daphnia pulex TaxID=6669 RepID=UPI001EDE8933|nr:secretory carrier-associated membrane protein 5-like [Daphnia pulex]
MQDPSRGFAVGTDPLADYNPFGNPFANNQTAAASVDPKTKDHGASKPPSVHVAPVISPKETKKQTPQQQVSMSAEDFLKRQEELERKAQELQKREEELQKNALFNANNKANNWPPLPKKFCVEPCFYQDIQVEIKVEFQPIVNLIYYTWLMHALLYLVNVGGCLALFIQMGEGTMFGLSILYCILFTPASYIFWFRPAYKAFKSDSSFNFMVFFVFFFSQLIATIIQAVGIPNLGTCGFIVGLAAVGSQESSGDLAVGIIVLIIACGFGLVAFGDFLLLVRVSRLYRSTGASLSKARSEFTSGVMGNEHVRQATTDVITNTVRVQMDNIGF